MRRSVLLGTDAVVNLLLGAVLVVFPRALVDLLGIPTTETAFYPSVLGAVLLGIGISLVVEARSSSDRAVGLGLTGAVIINLCGGIVLAVWLLAGRLELPARGLILLWVLVLVLVGLSCVELATQVRTRRAGHAV